MEQRIRLDNDRVFKMSIKLTYSEISQQKNYLKKSDLKSFFLSSFPSRTMTIHRTSREWEGEPFFLSTT